MINPFYPRNSRLKYYAGVVIIFTLISLSGVYDYEFSDYPTYKDFVKDYGKILKKRLPVVSVILYIVNIILAIIIAIRLNNKKSSLDLKRKVLNRHFKYFAIFFLVIVYSLLFVFANQLRSFIFDKVSQSKGWKEGDEIQQDQID